METKLSLWKPPKLITFVLLLCYAAHAQFPNPFNLVYRVGTDLRICLSSPTMCQTFGLPTVILPTSTGDVVKLTLSSCPGTTTAYFLVDGATADEIFAFDLFVFSSANIIADAGFTSVASFDVCCDRLFISNGNTIYVQNIDVTSLLIRRAILTAHSNIGHLEVSCSPTGFQHLYYSIDGDGLYRANMDGTDIRKLISYDVSDVIVGLDVNPVNQYLAIGLDTRLFIFNYVTDLSSSNTRALSSLTPALQTTNNIVDVNVVTLITNEYAVAALWDAPSFQTLTLASGTITTLGSFQADDIFYCVVEDDCIVACNDCACPKTDFFQECCNGLCVPRTDVDGHPEPFSCHCRTSTEEKCTVIGELSSVPIDCPLDLVGAINPTFPGRRQALEIYAVSTYSTPSLCKTNSQGKQVPIPFGIPLGRAHSIGYRFSASSRMAGEKFGTYTVSTDNYVTQLPSGLPVNTLVVIVQGKTTLEKLFCWSAELKADYITVSAILGSKATLQVQPMKPIRARQIRWRKNGFYRRNYNGERKITIQNVDYSDEGIYEAYFRGRFKRNWRLTMRLIIATDTCDSQCRTNGGVCNHAGTHCICPPGKVGEVCTHTCGKGSFGMTGQCDHNCADEFGSKNCKNILFCLQDPFGCQCYPGFKLPDCSACRRGFWGINCESKCSCSYGDCDSFDGTCL
ncbi:Tyrosine-protein kinase receptor Tie-1 [Holothuria leucospilota]|uniref:Tyrosine-protein kinase receptor Tie-1 n=1 Tax=Holothuria leucospilota TaxID=206669 RepID=A0A9Q1BY88_HOLLE|nr:Tyrosine-protein kinase receptor Tie-1 [Holothuria leucospilota]